MAAMLLAAISTPAGAQDRPREPGQSQEPIPLPALTVPGLLDQPDNPSTSTTGTKIEAPLRDIPQAIQVVPRKVIDDQRAITLSDVLRNVSGFSPSVNSQSQRFGDRSVIFRGFTVNNYYTNGYKDPFNGSSFTTGLGNVERVEVLPFHQMGRYKWERLGMKYECAGLASPMNDVVERTLDIFRSAGLKAC
jgi:outer membrane receptor protein involved in Fe transport